MNNSQFSINAVAPSRGYVWWLDSWFLIQGRLLFALGIGLFVLLPELVGQVPLIGGAVEGFFTATLGLGSMAIFVAWDRGEKISFSKLFLFFTEKGLAKRTAGLCFFIAGLGLLADLILIGEQLYSNPDFLAHHTFRLSLAPFSLLLYCLMALVYGVYFTVIQFVVPLVYFARLGVIEATRVTSRACRLNWKAMAVNLVMGIVLLALAVAPFGLGLLLFFPMMLVLPYIMYKDLFVCMPKPLPAENVS